MLESCLRYVLAFVRLLIAFSVSMYVTCVILFVQRFEPRGRRLTNFHFYYYLDQQIFVSAPGVVE